MQYFLDNNSEAADLKTKSTCFRKQFQVASKEQFSSF